MATYGTAVYGEATYGAPVVGSFAAPSLTANDTRYGEITLNWDTPPGSWSGLRLVRNPSGTPIDASDGAAVFTDGGSSTRTSYVDGGLTLGRDYYYALFVQPILTTSVIIPPGGLWVRVGTANALTTDFLDGIETLYSRVPEYYKTTAMTAYSEQSGDYQNTSLYRFLSTFGYHLDSLRTETAGLLKAYDPLAVNERLLPSLAASLGMPYEDALGSRAMRRLTANAANIWHLKGTTVGVRDLATVVTGWEAHVFSANNLALTVADSGPTAGVGRWDSRMTSSRVLYRAGVQTPGDTSVLYGDGVRVVTTDVAQNLTVSLGPSPDLYSNEYTTDYEATPHDRALNAIPVIPQQYYGSRAYWRTAGTGVTVQPRAQWLDNGGNPSGPPVLGTAVAINNTWTTPSSTFIYSKALPDAYTDIYTDSYNQPARFLELSYVITGLTPGVELLQSTMVVNEYPLYPSADYDARTTLISLEPDVINYAPDTNGLGINGTNNVWSSNVLARLDPTYGQYLTVQNPGAAVSYPVELDDTELVDPLVTTDPYTVEYDAGFAPVSDVAPTESLKILDLQRVDALTVGLPANTGDVLCAAASVIDPDPSVGTRSAQIGFALWDGPDFIRLELSNHFNSPAGQWTPISYELTVPPNADYNRVSLVLYIAGGGAESMGFNQVFLSDIPLSKAFPFDGATPSPTGDFLWEGVPYQSRSFYYQRRATKVSRLSDMLTGYVAFGTPFALRFEAPPEDDASLRSPLAIAGSDIDYTAVPLETIGADFRSRWATHTLVGLTANTEWSVFGTPVGLSTSIRWNTLVIEPAVVGTVGLTANVDYDVLVRTPVGAQFQAIWFTDESFEIDDAEMVEDDNPVSAYEAAIDTTYVDAYNALYTDGLIYLDSGTNAIYGAGIYGDGIYGSEPSGTSANGGWYYIDPEDANHFFRLFNRYY